MHQKSLKSVNFLQSYWKNKRWTFFGHSVFTLHLCTYIFCMVLKYVLMQAVYVLDNNKLTVNNKLLHLAKATIQIPC